MAQIQTTAVFGDLAQRGAVAKFRDVFNQAMDTYDGMDVVGRIFAVESTTDSDVRDVGLAGLGLMSETEEGDAYSEDSNLVTYETNYHVRKLTNSTTVTEEKIKFSDYADKLDDFKHLGISAKLTKAKYGMNILNAGFGTATAAQGFTIYRYGDAKALFSTSHPRKDGGTAQSNASSTGITLTETNLETGRLALVKQLTDRGLPINFLGRVSLVVPDDLEKTATILAQSELRPSTANNDINFYNGRVPVIVSRWLNSDFGGSATAWFLVDMNMKKLKLYSMQEPTFDSDKEVKTKNTIFTVSQMLAAGHSDWRGTWGSKGDGAAYSG